MATPVKTAITTPAISTTGIRQRTVSDTIRHLFPGNPIMGFVSSGAAKGVEDVVKENFRIGKAIVNNTLYENYTYTPLAISTTIATYSSASSFTLTDYNDVTEGMILVDTTNRTACRVSALSTATVTATSIGSTAFSSAAGRTVLILPSTYKENSTSPYVLMKDEDNLYNVLQINRQAWEISASAEKVPYYGSPAYWKRLKQRGLVEYLRKKESAFLFNERASSGETTTDATLGNFRTTRGIWQWGIAGGTSDDVGGAFTYDYMTQTLATKFHSSVGANTKKIGLCGTTTYGIILGQFQDKATITLDASKEYKDVSIGAKVTRITTAKGDIDIMLHDLFDKTGLDDTMLIFNPDRIEYVHMTDRDDKVKLNIQGNDQDGYKDEVLSEWGVRVDDGGASTLILTNLW
jgi:hypothetical protein